MHVKVPHISKMPNCMRAERFCCCLCSLKSGTVFIGIVYTLFSLMSVSAIFSYDPSFDNDAPQGVLGYEFGKYGIETLLKLVKISSVIWFLVNLSLLYGTLTDRSAFIAPWVAWHMVLFFVQIIVAIWAGNIVFDVEETIIQEIVDVVLLVIAILINTGILLFFWITVNSYYIFLRGEEESLLRLLTTRFEMPIPVHIQNGRIFRDSRGNSDSFTAEYTPKPWSTQEPSANALKPWANPTTLGNTSIPRIKQEQSNNSSSSYQRPFPTKRPLNNDTNHKSLNIRQLPQKVLPPVPPQTPDASLKPKFFRKSKEIPQNNLWISQESSPDDIYEPKVLVKVEAEPEEIPYREPWSPEYSPEKLPYREPWVREPEEDISSHRTWKTQGSSEDDNTYHQTWISQGSSSEDNLDRWNAHEPSEEDVSYDQLWTPHLSPAEDGYFVPQSVVKLPLQTDC